MALGFGQTGLDHEALVVEQKRKLMIRVRRKLFPCISMALLAIILSAPYGVLGQQ